MEWLGDAWNGLQSVEFWGTVIGGAFGVLVGFVAGEFVASRRRKAERLHIRAMIVREVQANHLRGAQLWAAMRDDGKHSPRKMAQNAEPRFANVSQDLLLRSPEALTEAEANDLMDFRHHLDTIHSLWALYRSAYLLDLDASSMTMTAAGSDAPQMTQRVGAGQELRQVSGETRTALVTAFRSVIQDPPRWAVRKAAAPPST